MSIIAKLAELVKIPGPILISQDEGKAFFDEYAVLARWFPRPDYAHVAPCPIFFRGVPIGVRGRDC